MAAAHPLRAAVAAREWVAAERCAARQERQAWEERGFMSGDDGGAGDKFEDNCDAEEKGKADALFWVTKCALDEMVPYEVPSWEPVAGVGGVDTVA